LLVVPVVYTYLDDFGAWAARIWRGKAPRSAHVENGVFEEVR
jgi:HAE1 family hydrophobic/amphiphilic exporter-1